MSDYHEFVRRTTSSSFPFHDSSLDFRKSSTSNATSIQGYWVRFVVRFVLLNLQCFVHLCLSFARLLPYFCQTFFYIRLLFTLWYLQNVLIKQPYDFIFFYCFQLQPLPSEEHLQQKLQDTTNWQAYKTMTINKQKTYRKHINECH